MSLRRRDTRPMVRALAWALCLAPAAAQAFDLNGVPLGAGEADARRIMPSAYCKPLEWKSRAADTRCDDARIVFAGVPARATAYLRAGVIEGFDVRFDVEQRDHVMGYLKSNWGAPASEAKEAVGRREQPVFRARWKKGGEQALLSVPEDRQRATLRLWRGDFDAEIYRVR